MKLFLSILLCVILIACDQSNSNNATPDTTTPEDEVIAPAPTAEDLATETQAIQQAQAQAQEAGGGQVADSGGEQAQSAFVSVCDRTEQVKQRILRKVNYGKIPADHITCEQVTAKAVSAIRYFSLERDVLPKITSLKAGDFQGFSSLENLNIDEQELSGNLDPIFQGLSSLKILTVTRTKLSSLSVITFQGLSSLKILTLSLNQLAYLPADIFKGLSSLETLALNNNKLISLPVNVFQGLSSLRTLYLHYNNLTSLPAGLFKGLTFQDKEGRNLSHIILNNNNLTSLPAGVFEGLTPVTDLLITFRNNQLSTPEQTRIRQYAKDKNITLRF